MFINSARISPLGASLISIRRNLKVMKSNPMKRILSGPSVFFSAAHDAFRLQVSEFVSNLITPEIAQQIDKEDVFPVELMKKIGDAGLIGTTFPQQYGGLGLDTLSWVIVMEEVARHSGSMGINMNIQGCVATKPFMFGTKEQKSKFLVTTLKGNLTGAFALTEPNSGSDALNMDTTAQIAGDSFILNGTKTFISQGAVADFVIVFAKTIVEGKKKISAFIVEKDMPGFSAKQEPMMGNKGTITSQITFDNVKLPADHIIGEVGDGIKIILDVLFDGRITVSGISVGIIRACYEESLRYLGENYSSDIPLHENQQISPALINMAADYKSALFHTIEAALRKDMGLPIHDEASFAKLVSTESAVRAASTAINIQGLRGCSMESPAQRLLRDAKVLTIVEGTSELLIKNLAKNSLK